MDPQSQADAIAFGTRRLLQVLPKAPSPRVWSERSVTFQHQTETTAELALLTRDDGTPSSLRELNNLPPPIVCLARFRAAAAATVFNIVVLHRPNHLMLVSELELTMYVVLRVDVCRDVGQLL